MGEVPFYAACVLFSLAALAWALWNVYAAIAPHQERMRVELGEARIRKVQAQIERDRAKRSAANL